jgi:hypothetical protein
MAPENKAVVVYGGFKDEEEVRCSDSTIDVLGLRCNHEEADVCLQNLQDKRTIRGYGSISSICQGWYSR